jgi:hypothetical protein
MKLEDQAARAGAVAILQGVQASLALLHQYEAELIAFIEGKVDRMEFARANGLLKKAKKVKQKSGGIKGFWARMSAAERSAEIKRRRAVSDKRKAA